MDDIRGNYNKLAVGDVNQDGCADIVLAGFLSPAPAPDPYQGQPNRLLLQNRSGGACQGTFRSQDIRLCELDGTGAPEILVGNGDIVSYLTQANRVLRLNATTGNFEDVGTSLGFQFASIQDLTEDIECGDLNHDGVVDAVIIGNVGGRNWLYRKH